PVRRHAADRGDLLLSRYGQPDARRGAQRRPADHPVGRAHLLHRGPHHQHGGRRALPDPQSEAEDRMSKLPAWLPTWLRSGRVITGLAIVAAIALIAIFAPLLAPHDPNEQNLISTLLPPAWQNGGDAAFPFGTDSLGRCTLSRLIYGAR